MAEGFAVAHPEQESELEQKVQRPHHQHPDLWAWSIVVGAAGLWWIAWQALEPLASWLTYDLLGLAHGSRMGESVAFFLYDVPKILLLLSGMIFLVTVVRTFLASSAPAPCWAAGGWASAMVSLPCSAW